MQSGSFIPPENCARSISHNLNMHATWIGMQREVSIENIGSMGAEFADGQNGHLAQGG